jgi:hypothetical protein
VIVSEAFLPRGLIHFDTNDKADLPQILNTGVTTIGAIMGSALTLAIILLVRWFGPWKGRTNPHSPPSFLFTGVRHDTLIPTVQERISSPSH